jgi:hypothetical protein
MPVKSTYGFVESQERALGPSTRVERLLKRRAPSRRVRTAKVRKSSARVRRDIF